MKTSEVFRRAAERVSLTLRHYRSRAGCLACCEAIARAARDGGGNHIAAWDVLDEIYRNDARLHGEGCYWWGGGFKPEAQQARVLALLFAALLTEDEERKAARKGKARR